jgi:acyl-CoA synthetase (AMP-forming)/AMP-acid ligase II
VHWLLADADPHRVALIENDRVLDYQTLGLESDVVANELTRLGVQPGQRVLVVCSTGMMACVAVVACVRAGFVLVPCNPGYQAAEMQHVYVDSGAAIVLCDAADEDHVRACVGPAGAKVVTLAALSLAAHESHAPATPMPTDVHDDDVAMIIYTSGTTGRSKGCVHTQRSVRAGLVALRDAWSMCADDVLLHTLPLFHVHGLCVGLLQALFVGAAVHLADRFSPSWVMQASKHPQHPATMWMAVPTMIVRMIDFVADREWEVAPLGGLRLVTCGSAPLAASEMQRFRALTGQVILERYGMSETMITLSNPLEPVEQRVAGSVGMPIGDVRMRVVDGELWISSSSLMRGYWNRADADEDTFVQEDGARWLRTGDAVDVDATGRVTVLGRRSLDVLKVGGYKISTREIEDAIATHPAVLQVAVIGLPDREWGQQVCAVVVLRATPTDHASLSLEDLQQHVQLHASKKPRRLAVVEALPRNAMGKVQKSLLVARLAQP